MNCDWRKWWRLALLALGLVGACLWQRKPAPRWHLPDGTTLTYLGFTYGTNHPSPTRYLWERWALPAPVARWLPSAGWSDTRPSFVPELRLWFKTDRPLARGAYRWDLIDESGFRIADFFETHLASTNAGNGLRLDFGTFPRPGETLRLVGWRGDQSVVELQVPNPRRSGSTPVPGESRSLPQTVSRGEIEFTLTGFETGLASRPGFQRHPAEPFEEPVACLDFVAAVGRVPDRHWFPLRVRMQDPEGHVLPVSPREWLNSANGWAIKIQPAPWAGPRWRLQVEFSRNEGFAPEELVTLRNLQLGGGHGLAVNQTARVGERVVELRSLKPVPSPNREWKADARLYRPEPGVSLTLLGARDQLGRKLWIHPRHLTFRIHVETESVDLVFAVHESRFAEFQASPVDVRSR